MQISSNFEGGSINVVAADRANDIRLSLKKDNAADFMMWFYYRLTGARGQDVTMSILNAGESNGIKDTADMPDNWDSYNVMASYDHANWFRVKTHYDKKVMNFQVKPERDQMYFATFVPHSMTRMRQRVGRWAMSPRAKLEVLGQTPDGQDLDMMTIGQPGKGKKVCWFMTRQHPSESSGSWLMEGVIDRLLDDQDPVSRTLLDKAVFYVIPNLNPDGTRRGNTRSNARGMNLNRAWLEPTMDKSPEVHMVRERIEEYGIDFSLDAHAWAGTHMYALGPYNVPSITPKQTKLWQRYEAALAKANPDFEVGWKYPGGGPAPGKADCAMQWNWASEKYGAIGVLYELLFKDNAHHPDATRGWSVARNYKMGIATLDALHEIIDDVGRER